MFVRQRRDFFSRTLHARAARASRAHLRRISRRQNRFSFAVVRSEARRAWRVCASFFAVARARFAKKDWRAVRIKG
jgi:hypothetical protein